MPLKLTGKPNSNSLPVWVVEDSNLPKEIPEFARGFAKVSGFSGQAGEILLLPASDGSVCGLLFSTGGDKSEAIYGKLGQGLPKGDWHMARELSLNAAVFAQLGAYVFKRYKKDNSPERSLFVGATGDEALRVAEACSYVRDLINTPTNDMTPETLEAEARAIALQHGAEIAVTTGDDLLASNFPLIHAVGRASAFAPRLIDMVWGKTDAPKVTLVGKGVCFDTGGLDIKPSSSMLLMKKDMGGAAHVLGLARMIMEAGRNVRLRVLIPAVENSISSNAFRPGDVLKSRKGDTVEIGNTDAEGRLVLADALTLATDEKPDLLIDMATLTGAARVALGPDVIPFYTDDEAIAIELAAEAKSVEDPVWRMPLWKPYAAKLGSKIADTNNVTSDGFAGSITAALFLQRFVPAGISWVHFDLYGWTNVAKPACPIGGEAQTIRALDKLIAARYG
ncbi:MAG: leucyl aminopeptidase family protein [Notoacmeibacter sp.]